MTDVASFAAFDDEAGRRDEEDPLRSFRDRFFVPPGRIYLDGNSLGLLSRDAEAAVLRVLAEWRDLGIDGWTNAPSPWFTFGETLGALVAPLIGAEPSSVIVTGSTTVNLHQCLATLFDPLAAGRQSILADVLNFPSDLFAIESHLRLRGCDPAVCLRKVGSRDGRTLSEEDIVAAFTPDVQVAVLPSVLFSSGQFLDMNYVTREARARDIVIGWDLSHSIGAVPHELDAWGADFAFWCHYKYLNAGPGAVGGLYLNRRHRGTHPGLAGWWGSDKRRQFDMTHDFIPADGAGALQIGTPSVLSMAPLAGTLRLHHEAGMARLREKSLLLTDFLRRIAASAPLAGYGFTCVTPVEETRRGGHIALVHREAVRLCRALRQVDVVPDFRPPDVVRLAPVPLYTSFADCVEAMRRLAGILDAGAHRREACERELVP